MKTFSFAIPVAAALSVSMLAAAAQQPAQQQPAAAPNTMQARPPMRHPAPTNLQVLPKNLTGEQVHDIMEKWAGDLGGNCGTCHTADPNNIGPNGRPRLNFADDSKKEKATARKMYQMTELINSQFISKLESDGEPVTCGTCHQGHLGPEPFIPKHENRPAPPPPGAGTPEPPAKQ